MTDSGASRIAVGVMTGTSLDGIDACALRVRDHGLGMTAEHLGFTSIPLGPCAEPLRALAADEPMPASRIAQVRRLLGEQYREAITALELPHIDLVALHGQTIHHAPPESWQLVDPFPVAQAFAARVVTDLRGLDRAAGGEGAPISPLADWILHRTDGAQVIVNLGGFVNCTILPTCREEDPLQAIQGFDVCPCNHLLDTVARLGAGEPYDDGGALALSGSVCLEQLQPIANHLNALHRQARSLGSGDECIPFVTEVLKAVGTADAAATFCAAIASTIAKALPETTAKILLLAGGGTRNAALVEAITTCLGDRMTVSRLVHGDEREAASMAVLGALAEDGVPITLPQVTGRDSTHVRDGTWVLDHEDQR